MIEDRLRNAYQRAAETIQSESLRPSVLDPAEPGPPSRRARGRLGLPVFHGRLQVLAPVAAAAAVVIIVAAAVVVPRVFGRAPAAQTTRPGPGAASSPFLAVIRLNGVLDIDSAKTGRLLTEVRSPRAGTVWGDVAVTGRTQFLLTAVPSQLYACANTLLYTLTLDGSGRVVSLRPFGVPEIAGTPGNSLGTGFLAASADGGTIALLTTDCAKGKTPRPESIVVIRGGTTRTWTIPRNADPESLSLSADGSELGYVDITDQVPVSSLGSAWVLPTDAAPGPADQRSHKVFTDVPHGSQEATAEVLSPDGRIMYLFITTGYLSGEMTDTLYAYGTATGTRLRTVHTWSRAAAFPPAITAVGHQAVVWCLYDTSVVVQLDLATGATTSLRLPAGSFPMNEIDG